MLPHHLQARFFKAPRLLFIFSFLAWMQTVATGAPEIREIDGVKYHVLITTPESIRLVWKSKDGQPLRLFSAAAEHLEAEGHRVLTLMNGGIFEPGGIPSGLLVVDGKEERPVNRAAGKGNFFLQPNGIFFINDRGAGVRRTDEWPPADTRVNWAVQSGPLLLHADRVHPAFNAASANRLHRNGVGVDKAGEVVLLMSDGNSPKFPNLHEFAMAFRHLGCADALFLDGDISQMRSGGDLRRLCNRFGSMIAVVEKKE
ncbi:MAG: phosphodiester glycosidase family protein [Verrucomicrobiales bacterium]